MALTNDGKGAPQRTGRRRWCENLIVPETLSNDILSLARSMPGGDPVEGAGIRRLLRLNPRGLRGMGVNVPAVLSQLWSLVMLKQERAGAVCNVVIEQCEYVVSPLRVYAFLRTRLAITLDGNIVLVHS